MKKINAGVWAGILLLLFSLTFLIKSFHLSYTSGMGPGPGFFPVWLSGIMVVLSLIYIFDSARGKSSGSEEWPKGQAFKNILFIVFSLVIFIILLAFAGFVISSVIFLFLLLYKAYKWYISLTISVCVSIFFFLMFHNVMSVPLPVNGLGF